MTLLLISAKNQKRPTVAHSPSEAREWIGMKSGSDSKRHPLCPTSVHSHHWSGRWAFAYITGSLGSHDRLLCTSRRARVHQGQSSGGYYPGLGTVGLVYNRMRADIFV